MNQFHSLVPWVGGKTSEIRHILANLPTFKNYYEPFVGGGVIYTNLKAEKYFINDLSDELITFYRHIANNSSRELLFQALDEILLTWNWCLQISQYKNVSSSILEFVDLKNILKTLDLPNKLFPFTEVFFKKFKGNLTRKSKRIAKFKQANTTMFDPILVETVLKSACYANLRHLYNSAPLIPEYKSAIFFFLRNFAYSAMLRYNSKGKFNTSYGGIVYNRKDFGKKIDYLKKKELKDHLDKTTIENLDFEEFFNLHKPTQDDFVFLDPPYDGTFSTYADNEFTKADHSRLANYLINHCKAKWSMILKNTDFIFNLYNNNNLDIQTYGKTYAINFNNRNERKVEHLFIKNF